MPAGSDGAEGMAVPTAADTARAQAAAHMPALYMLGVVGLCLVSIVLTLGIALGQPWLGLKLMAGDDGLVRIAAVAETGPAAALPVGAVLATLRGGSAPSLPLVADDIIAEPDILGTYAKYESFLTRQSRLAAAIYHDQVEIALADGRRFELRPAERPLSDLPADFWVQLVTGAGSLLIAGWVFAVRPREWAPRLFLISGFAMIASAHAAAIYSSREIALPADLFRVLSILNYAGSLSFGGTATALFLLYPRELVRPSQLLILPAVLVPIMLCDVAQVFESMMMVHYAPPAAEMVLIITFVVVQWFMTRRDAAARAALRWLGLTISLGASAFIVLIAAPALIGAEPVLSQGYAFGFFLLIYVGVALGMRRYQLFAIGEWSFRVLFFGGAVLMMLLLDGALIYFLHLEQTSSFGIALLLVGFLYLPLRDYVWRRTVARQRMSEAELFRAAADVAFTVSSGDRAARWREMLVRLFDPLEILAVAEKVPRARLLSDGTEMLLPATAGGPALLLRHPFGGKSLFSPTHLGLMRQMGHLMTHAESSRNAYERGVAEERTRVSRDLHDDVGARLLSGLHRTDIGETRKILREAIADIRTIAGALAGDRLPLSAVVADLRHETAQRIEAAGLALDWPVKLDDDEDVEIMVDYGVYRNFVSALREIVSNTLRHAGASRLRVIITWSTERLDARIEDDGIGLRKGAGGGNGLRNIAARIAEIGGRIDFPATPRGTAVAITLPLRRGTGAS